MFSSFKLPAFQRSCQSVKGIQPTLLDLWSYGRGLCSGARGVGDSDKGSFNFSQSTEELQDGDVYGHEFYSSDGKLIYKFDRQQEINENFNWGGFERAFGLDKLHDIDFEDWDPTTSADDIELKEDESNFDEVCAKIAKHMPEEDGRNSKVAENRLAEESDRSLRQLEEVVSNAGNPKDLSDVLNVFRKMRTCVSVEDSINLSSQEVVPSPPRNRHFGKRTMAEDGVTHKLQRVRTNTPKSALKPQRISAKKSNSQFANEHLEMPKNSRRPGYERRLRRLEAQMERIATEMLCSPDSDFHNRGASMHHVLLSPNGCLLNIFYEVDNVDTLTDKRAHKFWSKRICNEVRGALANQLYAKRVPRVKLVRMHSGRLADGKSGLNSATRFELDELFDEIARERINDQNSKPYKTTRISS